jgi:putative nucleotidyltransferase with HDIG domain
MDLLQEVKAHARGSYPAGDWPHIVEVVHYAQQLARATGADEEVVTIAAYFHDISRATMGPHQHNIKSAQMARQWLTEHHYPAERTSRIAAAIVAHMRPAVGSERATLTLEERILYDADKIGRAQGIGVVAALVQLGQKTSWAELGYAQLAAAVREGRRVTEETYHTLYTEAARRLAGPGCQKALAFCDQLLAMKVFQGAMDD